MSRRPPSEIRHLARVRPFRSPSFLRPVLTMCGRKVPADSIVDASWEPDPPSPVKLCTQCEAAAEKHSPRYLLKAVRHAAHGVRSAKAAR
jgi:hypothetical protein